MRNCSSMAKIPKFLLGGSQQKPFRVGSGDTFSFLANPSTLFSQDSFPPKNFDTKTHMVVCFSSASPPRFLFIWHLWCLTKKQVTKSIISTVGAACGPGISALGLAFLGVLCFRWWDGWIAVLFCHRKGGKGAPKAVVVKRRSYHSIERFASPFFFGQFFLACVSHPRIEKTMSLTSLPWEQTPFVLISLFWSCSVFQVINGNPIRSRSSWLSACSWCCLRFFPSMSFRIPRRPPSQKRPMPRRQRKARQAPKSTTLARTGEVLRQDESIQPGESKGNRTPRSFRCFEFRCAFWSKCIHCVYLSSDWDSK